MTLHFNLPALTRRLLLCAALVCVPSAPSYALTNASPTSSYSAVGDLGTASGVQVAPNWVLTATHVAVGLIANTSSFVSTAGRSIVDAVYPFSTQAFPANDISLVHLATPVNSSLPFLPSSVLNTSDASLLGSVTLVSAQNDVPNGVGEAAGKGTMTMMRTASGPATVNLLITQGSASVQGGDSGSALLRGLPTDSLNASLIGIASAEMGNSTSGYVQPAAYRAWIDKTMAPSSQHVKWLPVPVPEPSTLMMFCIVGLAWLMLRLKLRVRIDV